MLSAAPPTTIKINLQHNLSSLKIPQVRVDPYQTVLSLKQLVQIRYGSKLHYIRLSLFDRGNNKVAQLQEDFRTLNFYGIQDGYNVYIKDLNPNSIHKEIQDLDKVTKYTISQDDYNKLPQNFRKWKKKFHPKAGKDADPGMFDTQYMKLQAENIPKQARCKTPQGHRGTVAFVGKIPDLGVGYFIGIVLDQPFGDNNGKLLGVTYFQCEDNYGMILRPNQAQIGDFPVLTMDDEL